MRLPDFIIGGAPRCGTTWLRSVADRHPAIEMAKPPVPEPKFFLRDDLFARGLAYYSQTWFRDIPEGVLAGEKSTNYLESPLVAERIRAAIPSVKLVFILRDPVERAYSNYLWSRQNGRESRSFEDALANEEGRERALPEELRYARPHALFSRGLYAELLRPFLGRFPAENVLVLRYEDIASDPRSVAARLHRFLGVELRPGDGLDQAPLNAVRPPPEGGMNASTRARLAARYDTPNRTLYALLGPSFRMWDDDSETVLR